MTKNCLFHAAPMKVVPGVWSPSALDAPMELVEKADQEETRGVGGKEVKSKIMPRPLPQAECHSLAVQ